MDYKPKLFLPEMILLILVAVIIDVIGWVLLFFALDDFFILDLFGITIQGYFRIRKVNGAGYDLIASLIEFIPYVGGILPAKTIGVATVCWIDRHPKGVTAKAVAVGQKAMVVKKPATGAGGAPTGATAAISKPKVDGLAKAA